MTKLDFMENSPLGCHYFQWITYLGPDKMQLTRNLQAGLPNCGPRGSTGTFSPEPSAQ